MTSHWMTVTCLLFVPLCGACVTPGDLRDVNNRVTSLSHDVDMLKHRLGVIDAEIGRLEGRIESIWQVVERHGDQLDRISSSLGELRGNYLMVAAKLNDTVSAFQAQDAAQERQFQTLRSSIGYLRTRAQELTERSETNRNHVNQLHSDLDFLRTKLRAAVQELLNGSTSKPVSYVSHTSGSSRL